MVQGRDKMQRPPRHRATQDPEGPLGNRGFKSHVDGGRISKRANISYRRLICLSHPWMGHADSQRRRPCLSTSMEDMGHRDPCLLDVICGASPDGRNCVVIFFWQMTRTLCWLYVLCMPYVPLSFPFPMHSFFSSIIFHPCIFEMDKNGLKNT